MSDSSHSSRTVPIKWEPPSSPVPPPIGELGTVVPGADKNKVPVPGRSSHSLAQNTRAHRPASTRRVA